MSVRSCLPLDYISHEPLRLNSVSAVYSVSCSSATPTTVEVVFLSRWLHQATLTKLFPAERRDGEDGGGGRRREEVLGCHVTVRDELLSEGCEKVLV